MALDLELLHETASLSLVGAPRICIGRWRDVPPVEEFRAMHALLRRWARKQDRFVALNVVDVRAVVNIPEETRRAIADVQSSFDGKQTSLASVICDRGLFAVAVRAMMSGVQILSRTSFPQRVFGDIDGAIGWCLSTIGDPTMSAEDVRTIVDGIQGDPTV